MANINNRFTDNVTGTYYVDHECICCGICGQHAPDVFQESDEGGHHVVFHQPVTEAEHEQAEAALDHCPVEAIGNDGAA